jgi:hypothetical protein
MSELQTEGVMKKSLLGLMLGIVLCFGSVQEVSARYEGALTGSDILDFCTDPSNKVSLSKGMCIGFTNGVEEGYIFGTVLHGVTKKAFCKPKGVSRGQVQLIVVKYLKDNPEQLHDFATLLIVKAMAQAFPCQD